MGQITTTGDKQAAVISQISNPKLVTALAKFLPNSLSAERVVRQTLTLVRKTPDLGQCDPFTVLAGMIQAAELGFELSNSLGHAYLIPRWNGRRQCKEAVFQIGVKGYRKLAFNTGKVLGMRQEIVWPGDEFDFQYGTGQFIRHKPCGKEEGDPLCFYAYAVLLNGGEDFVVMTLDQVRGWRMKYAPPPAGKTDRSGWASNFNGMALKTVTGILSRRLPHAVHVENVLKVEGQDSDKDNATPGLSQMAEEVMKEIGLPEPAEETGEIDDAEFSTDPNPPAQPSQGELAE